MSPRADASLALRGERSRKRVVGRLVLALALGAPAAVAAAQASEPAFELSRVDPSRLVGAPGGRPLSGAALDRRTEEVAALLRCPVCQGLSVADSRAGTAVAMKSQVREMLAAGYDEEQVLGFFERSYGGFVRLSPPLRGINWLVWLAPLGGLLLGGLVVLRALRPPAPAGGGDTHAGRRAQAAPPASEARRRDAAPSGADTAGARGPAPLPARDSLPDDAELAGYVRRVRELAYGWPGGEPPKAA